MRGWVAISVTATPAAAPRRIREVLRMIIREPSGLRLRPTMGLDRREPRPCGTPRKVRVGLHRPLWQRPTGLRRPLLRRARPLPRTAPSQGYPFHPSEQDMISAAPVRRASSSGFCAASTLRDLSIDRYTPFLAQMKNVLASAGLGSKALAYLQPVSRPGER